MSREKSLQACAKCHIILHMCKISSGICSPLKHSIVFHDSVCREGPDQTANVQSDLGLCSPQIPQRRIFTWVGSYKPKCVHLLWKALDRELNFKEMVLNTFMYAISVYKVINCSVGGCENFLAELVFFIVTSKAIISQAILKGSWIHFQRR